MPSRTRFDPRIPPIVHGWQIALVLGWLCLAQPAEAQNPPAFDPFQNTQVSRGVDLPPPGVGTAIPADGRESPVETLESLTGQRVAEPSRGERDEIETDRDSFTPATTTVGRRRLVVESAYSFIDNRGTKETHSFPESILRYGLTERIELRLGYNYEVGGTGDDVTGVDAGGDDASRRSGLERLSQISYGFKVNVTDQAGWLPQSAMIVQAATPTTGGATATQLTISYAAGWVLPNRWKFDTGFRYQYASETGDRFNVWAPSAVLKVPLGEKWAVHAEYFGLFSSGKAENFSRHYFSPGVHYLVNSNLEVGVRVGWGLNEQTPRFFSNVGFGWRF